MTVLKNTLLVVLGGIATLLLVGLLLPSEYKVTRSIVVDAAAADVYEQVVDLKKWQSWGVWFKRDPNMQVTYSGPEKAIGMKSVWQSETQGNGEMEITDLHFNKEVVYDLYFPDMDMRSEGRVTITETDTGVTVEWSDKGDVGSNPINRYFVLFIDSMLGPDFEDGLNNLKTIVENPVAMR
ncbi:polyketide cyclase [Alteromonas sediminis]|uniref:Polyketide cyclase n=1 Tax=Alteromonas sediminis TaxID=2259342 RepID=A0A3N5ZBZ2_9ALTE|nr:SRPBCC family protein [Alteromonas sediminis]RPJ67268.1 polyketide cyclase [Alteromonas sediminis]